MKTNRKIRSLFSYGASSHQPSGLTGSDFRLMFEHSQEPAVIFSPVIDKHHRLVDALVHEANTAFSKASGISQRALRGRLVSQIASQDDPRCSGCEDLLKQVSEGLRRGQFPQREGTLSAFGREYHYRILPLSGGMLALLAADITTQRALERSEALAMRSAFQVEMQHLLIEAREKERLSIASQLHEGLLQSLIGLRFEIEEGLGVDQKEIRMARMARVQASLQREIQNLRDYCNDLRPSTLAPFGLEKTIRRLVEDFQKHSDSPEIVLDLAPDRLSLPEQARQVLYHAFRELFEQAVTRPGAAQVRVHFTFNGQEACLEITEQGSASAGAGREAARPLQSWMEMARHGQLELAAALERVEGAGGTVQITGTPGEPHITRLILPLRR